MLYNYFPLRIREKVKYALENNNHIEEIRVRSGQKIVFCNCKDRLFLTKNGHLSNGATDTIELVKDDLKEMMKYFTQNSVYAMQQDIKNGFITLPDGTRVGLCGRCVVKNGVLENINNISSFNIRLSKQIIGWGNKIFAKTDIIDKNVLIIAPPGGGKTTLLRNMIKYASDGGKNVSVVDEKCEISPIADGNRIYDLGANTDVLSDVSKKTGINIMLKTMNPDIIAIDELLTGGDFEIVKTSVASGVKIFATFHGYNEADYLKKAKAFGIEDALFDSIFVISKNKLSGRVISCGQWEE